MATTHSSIGETDIYASPSGMVGKLVNGRWVTFTPPIGVIYASEYPGLSVEVTNMGTGHYHLKLNGEDSDHDYAGHWESATYFDAAGNAIARPELATVDGDPQDPYWTPGPLVTIAKSTTSGTDGSTNIFASPSGMVGIITPGGLWLCYAPPIGVTYTSKYWTEEVQVTNEGGGAYTLVWNGVRSTRAYADRWRTSKYYDAAGNGISGIGDIHVLGDPEDIYFVPGELILTHFDGGPTPAPAPSPIITPGAPVPGGSSAPYPSPAGGTVILTPGGQPPVATGGGVPAAPFPSPGSGLGVDVGTVTDGVTHAAAGLSNNAKLALGVAAAFLLLRRK
jgi:hypothetical protein